MAATGEEIYSRTYDSAQVGWPNEIAAYLRWSRHAAGNRQPRVLELACGTGRVAIALAEQGCRVTGVDVSIDMIEVAKKRVVGGDPSWVVADMRRFELGDRFDICIIPAHSFQFMCDTQDQVAALTAAYRHLDPSGRLVVHLDRPSYQWLAGLPSTPPQRSDWTVGRPRLDPNNGLAWCMRYCWVLEVATEVAILHSDWIRFDEHESIVEAVPQSPMRLKIIGRAEMEHAMKRAGFQIEALYGDFDDGPPTVETSGQMLWIGKRA